MAHYLDSHGRPITLGPELNRGGEGAVFEVHGHPKLVAKIYHHQASPDKADKLRAMAALANEELLRFASWPLDVLHNGASQNVAGILMPRVSGYEEIHTLYSPAQRKTEYPDKDWHFLVHAARNCAIAMESIHRRPLVMGDVNPGNLLVSKAGTIFVIDCDSFQVSASTKLFLCEVGVKEFTPPELQSQSFRGIQRTPNHDRFALALMIFHLLFMGRHPFAGRFLGAGDMPIERAIREYRYAFSGNAAAWQMARPPQTLAVDHVAPELVPLFERAFARGSERPDARPTAMEWGSALKRLGEGLKSCGVDRGHKFSAQLPGCPWCDLMRAGAPNFFLSVTVRVTDPGALEIDASIRVLISSIEQPLSPVANGISSMYPQGVRVVPTPTPDDVEVGQSLKSKVKFVALGSIAIFAAGILLPILALTGALLFVTFGAWWIFLHLTTGISGERARRSHKLRQVSGQLKQLEIEWNRRSAHYSTSYRGEQGRLSRVAQQLKSLRAQHDQELSRLQSDAAARQLESHLQAQLIRKARLEGIGAGRQATLASYGVETADDIEWQRIVDIPGFGPALASTLVGWREHCAATFRFDAAKGIPPTDRQKLLFKYAQMKQQFVNDLKVGEGQLKSIEREREHSLRALAEPVRSAFIQTAQAKADLAAL